MKHRGKAQTEAVLQEQPAGILATCTSHTSQMHSDAGGKLFMIIGLNKRNLISSGLSGY